MRIALGIEYDGTRFFGWETQRGVRTIQPAVTGFHRSKATAYAQARILVLLARWPRKRSPAQQAKPTD